MSSDNIAARGVWGTVEWATDNRGKMPAREFYLGLSDKEKAKVNTLFKRLTESSKITNREKFKQLGPKAGPQARGLWSSKVLKSASLEILDVVGDLLSRMALGRKKMICPNPKLKRPFGFSVSMMQERVV